MEMFLLMERCSLLHFLPYGEEKYFLCVGVMRKSTGDSGREVRMESDKSCKRYQSAHLVRYPVCIVTGVIWF